MNTEQQLAHITVRLVVKKPDGIHYGTGFLLGIDLDAQRFQAFCVTNRHVLADAIDCSIVISTDDGTGKPKYGAAVAYDIMEIGKASVYHPDPNVDLAAFYVSNVLNHMQEREIKPFVRVVNRKDIPSRTLFSELGLAEDVIMIGYPNGLFDKKNNMPILRRGITATSPSLDFEGRPEFVIDCACFPGSSGSPVWLYQPTGFRRPDGTFMMGNGRIVLLGVLYAGPQVAINGQIVPQPIPTSAGFAVRSSAMMHLGYCIKSTELTFLDAHAKPKTATKVSGT